MITVNFYFYNPLKMDLVLGGLKHQLNINVKRLIKVNTFLIISSDTLKKISVVTNSRSALIYANTQTVHLVVCLNVLLEAIHVFIFFSKMYII